MALGLILRVSWICFLLFDGSAGLPFKGYGYRVKNDLRNLGDDGEDEALLSSLSAQSNWQASHNRPTGPVSTVYKPPAAQWPGLVSSLQNLPNAPSSAEVEGPINDYSRDWGLVNLAAQHLPLSSNYQQSDPAKPQPGPVQAQSASLGVAPTHELPAYPAGDSTPYASQIASSTSQAAKSPSFDSWQPAPASGGQDVAATLTGPGSPNQNLNSGSSGSGYYNPHLVYEDVFQYPEPSNAAGQYGQADYMSEGSSTSSTQQGSFPSYPTYVGAQPAYPSVVLSPSYGFSGGENPNFSQLGYQPRDEIPSLPQTYVSPQNVQVAQRVSEPILPPPPPSYIVQSRNGYQRARYLFNKSRYSPEVGSPLSVHSKGAKGNPGAPKGAKNPERTSVHG
ncbi:translation initiation factor IF-2-like [Anoplopoma fimbria]|uniref:translation initiation factor IF-2-like n=1 Tax=Anoplopoma fimbria TaxID=229290 RepID=UPI0023ED90F0|nr:translation initiation factor IF-2-like [Anoplopoma fimbria]